ncbi:hypothetical protein K491DRAFT_716013 [Lophiostoma macrostomum CBS 122681]|uniref:Cytochrome P450 n=1 Tax=Lophiostoma macrostomum CBS 122681 TaxID=1314788 RepID=A0A6A6T7I0_9PLEO|nr:hypothetical protein K491DRAFT_716013 [Lophiostoma macrostomum CBS 122681]
MSILYSNASTLIYGGLAALTIIVVHYLTLLAKFTPQANKTHATKTPPLVPYFFPFIGTIPIGYLVNPIKFFSESHYFAHLTHPIRLNFLSWTIYIIQGPENIHSLLSNTSTSNTIFNASFLRNVCGMSKRGVARFEDPSEWTPSHHDRKNYLDAAPLYSWSSSVIHKYLTGRSALQLSRRFEKRLMERVSSSFSSSSSSTSAPDSKDGVVLDDFITYFTTHITPALVDSLCGPGLISRNPTFPQDFWTVCENFPTYMKGYPQMLFPRAFKARQQALEAIKDWQTWASSQYDADTTPVNEDGDDAFWGSKFFRERYATFVYDMGFDAADMASNELGFLFGAAANATMNTYWCAIEVFRDKELLAGVREEVRACKIDTGTGDGELQFDVTHLLQQPLLQAIHAENLRLRCHNMFLRRTREDIKIFDWFIPKNKLAIAWSTP